MMNNISSNVERTLSFLQARDPSIISGNLLSRQQTKQNVKTELTFGHLEDCSEESGDNIKIYLRIKNAKNTKDIYKVEKNEIHCYIPATSTLSRNVKDFDSVIKKYQFSHIFDTYSTQEIIFNSVVKPEVLKFINGDNCTLMSYGASGSGKTYTMVGSISDPGIIPRTLEYLFKTLPKLPHVPLVKPSQSGEIHVLSETCRHEEVNLVNDLLKLANQTVDEHTKTYEQMQHRLSVEPAGILGDLPNVTLAVWVSFAEIYNEQIYDLLSPKCNLKATARPKLQLGMCNKNIYIKNLTNLSVSSGIQAYQILQYGLHNLNYAATLINSHSSRSHSIFTIKIAQVVNGKNISRLNYFNFCDLAGSERLKKTMNVGDRLKESNNINTSLLVLGRCISSIRESQKKNVNKLIPFRESKLTMLFQKALSGFETISMIVSMSPSFDMLEETQHVLNFSAIAKDITVKLVPITPKRKNRFSSYLTSKAITDNDRSEEATTNEDESEVNRLQTFIESLYSDLENVNRCAFEREQDIREEMTEAYTNIIKDIKQKHLEQIRIKERKHKEQLQLLRAEYESEKLNGEIIILSSSTDDDDEDVCTKTETTIPDIEDSKIQILTLQHEIAAKDKLIDNLTKTVEEARIYCDEIQSTYEEKVNNLIVDNLALTERNVELGLELQEYCKIIERENEIILS